MATGVQFQIKVDGPITPAQKNYLLDVLLKDKVMPGVERCKAIALVPTMTKAQASQKITELKALPWKSKQKTVAEVEQMTITTLKAWQEEAPKVVQGQGFYRGGSGTIYSYLYNPKKGFPIWKMLTEKLIWNPGKNDYDKKGSYVKVYSGSAKGDIEAGGKKLTKAEVVAHGSLMGYCLCCGKQLTDPVSVEQKIGPVCIKSYGAMLGF